ncbi:hypothetical protein ACTXT7_003481 [Hymenolepis weldensis]
MQGSDCSNSTSSCNSCSTPGSPFQVDGSRYLQANGNAFNLSQLSSLDHTPTPSSSNDPSFDATQAGHDSLGELLIPPRTLSSCESSRATVEDRLSRLESVESQDDHPAFTRTNSTRVVHDLLIELFTFQNSNFTILPPGLQKMLVYDIQRLLIGVI